MTVLNNVWLLGAIRFFQSLIPAYVIERLFWEQRGMTIQMVVYTEIIYAVTVVLLEVPTGILADKFSRKSMIVAGAVLGCAEFLILVFATQFWHFAAVVVLAGIGRCACSGSENALLYDSLLAGGKEHRFEKAVGRLNVCDFISGMIAALCGSFLATRFGFELNYWLSFAGMSAALALSLLLHEPQVNSRTEEPLELKTYIKASLLFFKENPGVSLVVLSGTVTGAALHFIYEFWQIYLNRLDIPVIYFGLFSAGLMLLMLPGNMLAHALLRRFSSRTLLLAAVAVFAAGFTYIAAAKDYSGLAALLVICLFSGIVEPIAAGYLHHRTDSSIRATIDSFQSLGLNAVHIVIGLGFGFVSVRFDIFGGYGFIALLCGLFFGYFYIASQKSVE
ncbi:MFS transporter [Paenibacillus ehimensis]|uniref:MFS transporter n=1 Tax=Paenibacillus ehimensis TaxID=79264 RepID=UPI001C3FC441|nr:MFS transporter [Paenibacillus ehimensis]MEC0208323.1 MFS transporter [Paenibacillus ehimensis]